MSEPSATARRPLLVSRRWAQVAVLVLLARFFGLGLAGYLNCTQEPPVQEAPRRQELDRRRSPRLRTRKPSEED